MSRMPDKPSPEELIRYLATPAEKRPFATYRNELLDPIPAYSVDETERLMAVACLFPGGKGVGQGGEQSSRYVASRISKLLIDLSWASSLLEGNTYTQLDTQVLIEYGKRNTDKPLDDAVMILNHKRAIEFMLEQETVSGDAILRIQSLLADDHDQTGESPHFLPAHLRGVIRSYTPHGLEIKGTSYIPPQAEDRPPGFLDKEFAKLIDAVASLPDPVNQSFYLMTRIPYLQPFYDANKRTARIACNIPLISHGLAPLSFVDFEKSRYMGGLIAFYELGDESLAKQAFLEAYLSSTLRYRPFGERDRIELVRHFEDHVRDAARYVLGGTYEGSPVWMTDIPGEEPSGSMTPG